METDKLRERAVKMLGHIEGWPLSEGADYAAAEFAAVAREAESRTIERCASALYASNDLSANNAVLAVAAIHALPREE